ncbi:MarR family transcriptional regulator [Loktanella sp. SALINAS62]|uniref:MarR family winged helix-turn-helix transcriptional regulator n=1 Tax=Loktanella sp. SALINAS62 TaxID=2706124 RepID=UPI001B8C670A|nr:MarR family transcriptional regulator [Loktanella sp. SALINAS62]MBS1301355.1 MarR family transcriptional regulator [Loktanella sp. SALINAS62]
MRSDEILEEIRKNWPEVLTHRTAATLLAHRLLRHPIATREEVLRRHDLAQAEFALLFALRCAPPPHEVLPTTLYPRLLISSGGLTKLVKRLADRGLLRRPDASGDRRVRPVGLTSTGRDLIETVVGDLREDVATQSLNDADFAEVERALSDLMRKLERASAD